MARGRAVTLQGFPSAAATIFGRPPFYLVIAVILGARIPAFAFPQAHPDTLGFLRAGRALLSGDFGLYRFTATYMARTHQLPPAQGPGFLSPAPQAFLAAPFALLPEPVAVPVWTAFDMACVALGLVLLYRWLRPRSGTSKVAFWLCAAWFPPLYVEVAAGQRGGVLLLLATCSILAEVRRPGAAGALSGVGAALKFYQGAMLLGVGPRRGPRYVLALAIVFGALSLAAFVPFGGPAGYVQGVLIPALRPRDSACGIVSVSTMWMRTVGGQSFAWLPNGTVAYATAPLDLPQVATILSLATDMVLVAGALFAARASRWAPGYGQALGFALGALIPGEVFGYQMLPLLPITVMLAVRLADDAAWGTLAGLAAVLLAGFWSQPCTAILPYVWTLAGLAVFAMGVWHHRLFRTPVGTTQASGSPEDGDPSSGPTS